MPNYLIQNQGKRSGWVMLGLMALPIFLCLSPFLLFGRMVANSDILSWALPFWSFFKTAVFNGQSFFWNPNTFSGFPSFVTATGGFFSPINYLVFRLLPLTVAYNWLVFLYSVLAGFFCAQFLRLLKLSFWPAYLGGLVYIFGNWANVFDLPILQAVTFLPLFFIIIWQLKSGWRWIIYGGLVTGLAFLSCHYHWLLMALIAGGFFALGVAYLNDKRYLEIILKFFAVFVIGVVIGAIQLIPALIYTVLSSRSAGLSFQAAAAGAFWPQDFISWLLPHFHNAFGRVEQLRYFGILPLIFIIAAFGLKSKRVKFFRWLFLGAIFLAVSYSPFFWLAQKLPILNLLRVPSRWLFIGSFAAAVLAGFGLQQIGELEKKRVIEIATKIIQWLGIFWLVLSGGATIIYYRFSQKILSLVFDYFDKDIYPNTTKLPIEHYHQIIEKMFKDFFAVFNLLNPALIVSLTFIFISVWMLKLFFKNKISSLRLLWMSALVVALNLMFVYAPWHQSIAVSTFKRKSAVVEFLENHPGKYFSLMPGFTEYLKLTSPYNPNSEEIFKYLSETLPPNFNLLYNLEAADYYDSLMAANMAKYLAVIGSDRATAGERLVDLDISLAEKLKLFQDRKKILDFLGIRYIISGFKLDDKIFNRVFESEILPYDIPVYIYENKEARPLAYLTNNVKVENLDNDKIIQAVIAGDEDRINCGSKMFFNTTSSNQSRAELAEHKNCSVVIKTNSDGNEWLIVSQNNLPGWTAKVDGNPAKLCTLNSVFMAVPVSAGEHEVELKYDVRIMMKEILPF